MSNIVPKQFLPDVGFDIPVWLQQFCIRAKLRLEGIILDPSVPAKPTGLVLTQVYTGVLLEWDAPLDPHRGQAVGYKVYRGTTNAFAAAILIQEIRGLDNKRYHDSSVPATGDYFYWLSAVNALYQEGQVTDSVTITVV